MKPSKLYTVHVTLPAELPTTWTFKAGYFPREYVYLADAQSMAAVALTQGATSANVVWPTGRKETLIARAIERLKPAKPLKLSGKMVAVPVRAEVIEDTRVIEGVICELPVESERMFIVTSPYGWGKGATIREALSKCRIQTPKKGTAREHAHVVYRAMLVHNTSTMDGLGGVTRPANIAPLHLGIVA